MSKIFKIEDEVRVIKGDLAGRTGKIFKIYRKDSVNIVLYGVVFQLYSNNYDIPASEFFEIDDLELIKEPNTASGKKEMTVKEFREKGYLQEVNRRFLHPLGLALEIKVNQDGSESFNKIWDCRDDMEGIYYGLKTSSKDRIAKFKNNKNFVDSELKNRSKVRKTKLGFDVEPIK